MSDQLKWSRRKPHYGGWGLALYLCALAGASLAFAVAGLATSRPVMALIAFPMAFLFAICAWMIWPARKRFQPR